MVNPALTYPPVPTHALSIRSISRLQKIQNAALRFAFNIKWDEFRTSTSLHLAAAIPPINVRLNQMARDVWVRMADKEWELAITIRDLSLVAESDEHRWFPRNLGALKTGKPEPSYL